MSLKITFPSKDGLTVPSTPGGLFVASGRAVFAETSGQFWITWPTTADNNISAYAADFCPYGELVSNVGLNTATLTNSSNTQMQLLDTTSDPAGEFWSAEFAPLTDDTYILVASDLKAEDRSVSGWIVQN